MKKKTGIFLIIGIVLALMLTGCGKQSVETETAHTTEEDKLQIGLSFDSFVIDDGCVTVICLCLQRRVLGQK